MAKRHHELRNGVYHYRRRIPVDIQPHLGGKQWWKRSLKTTNEREAEVRARALASAHDRLIERVRGAPLPEQLASIVAAIDAAESELAIAYESLPTNKPSAARAGALRTQALEAEAKLRRAMMAAAEQRLDTLPPAERKAIADMGGIESFFTRVGEDANKIAVRQATIAIARGVGRLSEREAATIDAGLEAQSRYASKDQRTLVKLGLLTDDDDMEEPDNPRINSAMEAWFKERKQGPYAVKRHRVAVRRFIELHGNLPVGEITKPMVREYVKRIEALPDHRKLPAEQRGGLVDAGLDVPRVSAPTVERHIVSLKALLTFCVEQDWIQSNVATGLKPPKDTRPKAARRRPFTREERLKLLAQAVEECGENGDMAWLVRLGAYTGARLEELAQLARTNVREIDGIWVVEIDDLDGRNVKTEDSVKQVPLHPAIRDEFVAWVGSGRGARVFASFRADGEGRYANKVSGDFARLMDRAGLTDPRLVFHSLRHTLKREMSNARVDPDVRRAILGHAPKDAHDGYAGHSLAAVAQEFARMPAMF
jgi:integrase